MQGVGTGVGRRPLAQVLAQLAHWASADDRPQHCENTTVLDADSSTVSPTMSFPELIFHPLPGLSSLQWYPHLTPSLSSFARFRRSFS